MGGACDAVRVFCRLPFRFRCGQDPRWHAVVSALDFLVAFDSRPVEVARAWTHCLKHSHASGAAVLRKEDGDVSGFSRKQFAHGTRTHPGLYPDHLASWTLGDETASLHVGAGYANILNGAAVREILESFVRDIREVDDGGLTRTQIRSKPNEGDFHGRFRTKG